ncbi:RDD family protein [Leeuwenhoekiella sp. H156]|uniref:RDD family protein n=1 Tax=Leeuwenhoekiella sp. H156 TaxID=3450128 RepID=UPI003FA466B0
MNNPEEIKYKGLLHKEVKQLAGISLKFHRIASMFFDHFIMSAITLIPVFLVTFLVLNDILHLTFLKPLYAFFFLGFIYLNKDFFRAKSPGKRVLGYQVIDVKTLEPASELQCFIRNMPIILIWPIEVLVSLINPQRRIGDFIARTQVVRAPQEKLSSFRKDFKNISLKRNFVLIVIIWGVYFYVFSLLFPNLN